MMEEDPQISKYKFELTTANTISQRRREVCCLPRVQALLLLLERGKACLNDKLTNGTS